MGFLLANMKKLFLLLSLFLILPAQAQELSSTTIGNVEMGAIPYQEANLVIDVETIPSTTPSYEVGMDRELIVEPIIRVGLKKTKDTINFISAQDYQIVSNNEVVGILGVNEATKINYKNGKYFLKSDSLDLESNFFWRFEPIESDSIFTIPGCKLSYTGRKLDYCAYRGTLEYRYSPKSQMPYLVNELPLEEYIKGIAETDNNSAEGYIKAVLVAARSYAYKNISADPPTEKRLFDVYATTKDQLYLGYTSEQKMPRVAQLAEDTAGEMVTYESAVVTTPYSSRTNGYTKTWKNYKGVNDRPWLQSVECIYDQGKRQWGHAIGMSTHDALMRASKDGWGYIQLLQYYYTGTQVEKIY